MARQVLEGAKPKNERVNLRLIEQDRRKLETLAVTSGLGSMSAVVTVLLRQCDGILPPRSVWQDTQERSAAHEANGGA